MNTGRESEFHGSAIFDAPRKACPLCGSPDIAPHRTITRFTTHFRVDRCRLCGFIFTNPPFADNAIKGFYTDDYYRGSAEYNYFDEREAERYASYVWDSRLRVIRRYVKEGNFLDVGSSFGGFLRRAGRYYSSYGIEMSEYSASHARNKEGLNVHTGTLADHPFDPDFFSVITMIEVLEHLKDPAPALKECFGLLKEGGLLVIQTANMDGLQARILKERYGYYLPGHLSYFSMRNLSDALRRTGFSRIKVYRPVEFGLLPKLKKSRYNFRSLRDYLSWIRITRYHVISRFACGNFSPTSSMVIYAVK